MQRDGIRRRRVVFMDQLSSYGGGNDAEAVVSVRAAVFFSRDAGGELGACLGIDVQATRSAPARELVGPQVRSDHELALPPRLAFQLLGLAQPVGMDLGEEVAVFHHGLDAGVILGRIPGDADCARGLVGHGDPLLAGGVADVDAVLDAAEEVQRAA